MPLRRGAAALVMAFAATACATDGENGGSLGDGGVAAGADSGAVDTDSPSPYLPPYSGPDVASPIEVLNGMGDAAVQDIAAIEDVPVDEDAGVDCTPTNVGGTILCL